MRNPLLQAPALIVMVGTAVAIVVFQFGPGLDRWAGVAPWLLLWGAMAYLAVVFAATGTRESEDPGALRQLVRGMVFADSDIRRRVYADGASRRSTLVPLVVGVAAAAFLWLLGADFATVSFVGAVLVAGVGAALGAFVWRTVVRYPAEYDRISSVLSGVFASYRA